MCEALLNEGSNSSELHLLQKTNDMSETICFCWGQTTFTHPKTREIAVFFWLVVSTHLKNISQVGSFPQVGVKIKNI